MKIEDDFAAYYQTRKLYNKIKEFYQSPISKDNINPRISVNTPFPIAVVYINICIGRFNRKPKEKIIRLSFIYLDEIGYKY